MKRILLLFISVLLVVCCNKESTPNCNMLQTEEKVNALIEECNENKLETLSDIEENLIGEWTLSGIISGWFGFEPISECLLLTINSESLRLENLITGEEFSSKWKIVWYEVNDYQVFYLEPEDEDLRWKVGMQFFSKDIIYGAGFADDTDNYVYEKVN